MIPPPSLGGRGTCADAPARREGGSAAHDALAAGGRFRFIDGLRGLSVVCMVFNHTARWWMDGSMGWGRYHLVYFTLALGVPVWLFLVGFSSAVSCAKTRPAELAGHARRQARRGLMLILAGYALNVLVFPQDPWYGTTALHCIGLAMAASPPLLWCLRHGLGRWAAWAAPFLCYGSFVLCSAEVEAWVGAHSAAAPALFFDFAPWPWLAAVFLGLPLGWCWAQEQAAGKAGRRFVVPVAAVGMALVVAFMAWAQPGTGWGDFRQDFLLNHHWIPKPTTLLLMYGTTGLLFALLYWLLEIQGFAFDGLIALGRSTLAIYFVHHLIGLVVMKRALGLAFDNWPAFLAANLAFIVCLAWLGRLWLSAKTRWAGLGKPARRR